MAKEMTKKEARACLKQIGEHVENLRTLLLDFYHRRGWEAMEYPTIEDCLRAEFEHHKTWFYRQLTAARIEEILELPIGNLPESQARELSKLDNPEEVREVYQQVMDSGKVTAATIEDAVARKLFDALPPDKQLEMIEAERTRYREQEEQTPALQGGLLPEQVGKLRQAVRLGARMHQALDQVGEEVEGEREKLEAIIDRLCDQWNVDRPRLRRAGEQQGKKGRKAA